MHKCITSDGNIRIAMAYMFVSNLPDEKIMLSSRPIKREAQDKKIS